MALPRTVHQQPRRLIEAGATHRGHAIIEQIIADLKNAALAHLPSGKFAANPAWLPCAGIAFNLTRTLASDRFTRATTATIRARILNFPARMTRSQANYACDYPPGGYGPGPGRTFGPQ